MIVFDLVCEHDHEFEGWFKDAAEFVAQQNTGLLTCPVCGTDNIVKVPSASHISIGNKDKQLAELANLQQEAAALVNKITDYVTKNFEDVGEEFAQVARKMHYGQEDERNIYGSASMEEARELNEEGIDIFPLPGNKKDKLN